MGLQLHRCLRGRHLVIKAADRVEGEIVYEFFHKLCRDEEGQDVAEYAIMLAVILVIVVGTVRMIGSNAGNVYSQVGSSIQ